MGSHPLNLTLRFALEVVALVVAGLWGWRSAEGWLRWALMPGLPLLMAGLWVTFAVPGDPSRSGNAPIVTPGLIRLLMELAFFFTAAWCLVDLSFTMWGLVFLIIVVIHYIVSYDRIAWLFRQ